MLLRNGRGKRGIAAQTPGRPQEQRQMRHHTGGGDGTRTRTSAQDQRSYRNGPGSETSNRRSETIRKCPRPDTHLTYTFDIALTTEFSLAAGGGR
jgi:hypothetical protein